jgi:hypothetical protein
MFQTSQSTTEFRSTVSRSYTTSWEVDKDFVANNFDQVKGGVCVRVSVLRLEFPKHSYSIGWKHPSGELKFHFQSDQQVDPNLTHSLLESAQAHVKAEVMKVNDIRAKKDAERQKIIDEEKIKKAAKKKQYEANVEQRRNENRIRSSQGGSGGGKGKK